MMPMTYAVLHNPGGALAPLAVYVGWASAQKLIGYVERRYGTPAALGLSVAYVAAGVLCLL